MRGKISPERLAQLLLFATVAIWGSTFVIVKDALRDASPLVFNLIRMSLATVVLAIVNRRQLRGVTRSQLLKGAAAGCLLAGGYSLQTLGLARTTAAKSGFLTGLVVVFVPLLTLVPRLRPAGTPRPGVFTGIGTLLAFAGLLLLTTPPGTAPAHLFTSIGVGDLLTLGCAIAFAAHLLTLGHVSHAMSAGMLGTVQIGAATVVMLAVLPLDPAPHLDWTVRLGLALAITSVLGTAAAFTIQSYAQRHLPPAHTAVILTLEPVFACITSMLVLGERMSSRAIGGGVLILAGIAAIELLGHTAQSTEIPA
jgi:drug/metabolite transporter (DMT)-like permease